MANKDLKTLKVVLLIRKDSLANWTKNNPILRAGQMSYVNDTGRCKVGDGHSHWLDLPFFALETDIEDADNVVMKPENAWRSGADRVISKKGIVYIYTYNEGQMPKPPKIKIGDGISYIVDLPFVTDQLQDRIDMHIANIDMHVSPFDRAFWNNKLNMPMSEVTDNTLFFNRQ